MNAHLGEGESDRISWLIQEFTMPSDALFLGIDIGLTGVNSNIPGVGSGVAAILHNITTPSAPDINLIQLPFSAPLSGSLANWYRVYFTDVSAFDGDVVQLKFAIWVDSYQSRSFWADNIRFMTAEEVGNLPEPTTLALIGLGALTLLRRGRRSLGRAQ